MPEGIVCINHNKTCTVVPPVITGFYVHPINYLDISIINPTVMTNVLPLKSVAILTWSTWGTVVTWALPQQPQVPTLCRCHPHAVRHVQHQESALAPELSPVVFRFFCGQVIARFPKWGYPRQVIPVMDDHDLV